MFNQIKWKRLRKILKDICKREVEITLTTHIFYSEEGTISAVVFNEDHAEFLLSMNEVKDLEKVIQALAHEIAHVQLGYSDHTNEFYDMWKEMEEIIKDKYYED